MFTIHPLCMFVSQKKNPNRSLVTVHDLSAALSRPHRLSSVLKVPKSRRDFIPIISLKHSLMETLTPLILGSVGLFLAFFLGFLMISNLMMFPLHMLAGNRLIVKRVNETPGSRFGLSNGSGWDYSDWTSFPLFSESELAFWTWFRWRVVVLGIWC